MKKIISISVLLIIALALTGCIETTTLVKVNRSGSGTIEQTIIISGSFMELMSGLSGQTEDAAEGFDILDEEELAEDARNMGEGVSFVSAEEVSSGKGSGYRAVYRFQDINKIRINQNPGQNVPDMAEGDTQTELICFQFRKGNPATLIVLKPTEDSESEEAAESESSAMAEDDMGMMEMMRELYQDMKISIAIEVEGTIVDTNATYRDGSRVTIMELDFGELLKDDETFNALVTAQPESLEETKELFKDYEGIKVDLQDEIRIRFR